MQKKYYSFYERKKYIFFSFIICLFASAYCFAQADSIDAVDTQLKSMPDDTSKIILLIKQSQKNLSNFNIANKSLQQALVVSKNINNKYYQSRCFQLIGNLNLNLNGDFDKAMYNYIQSLKIAEETGNKVQQAKVYNSLGSLYGRKNNFKEALKNYTIALVIKEKIGDINEIAPTLNNLGNLYYQTKQYDSSLYYHSKALDMRTQQKDTLSIAVCYDNMGNAFAQRGQETKNKNDYFKASDMYDKSLKYFEASGNELELSRCYVNLAEFYFERSSLFSIPSDIQKALDICKKGLDLSTKIGHSEAQVASYGTLADIYESEGKYETALNYFKQFKALSDSLNSVESSKNIAEMQTTYDVDKKDKAITILNKDKKIQNAELNKQKIVRNSFIGGFVLVLIFSFFLYRNYNEKKKVNIQLSDAKSLIEAKNKNITDSINYAQRIQQAILPSKNNLIDLVPQSFILFQPKDIVSGDFYWFGKVNSINQQNNVSVIVAADCTGHGVPGAFMSMIGNNLLNEIINEKKITQPSEILNHLNNQVRDALKQNEKGAETNDGMDVSVCCIDTSKSELQYAGANRPLYIFRKQHDNFIFEEIKPSKFPIGGSHYGSGSQTYANHTFKYNSGDTFYLFSDGYCDQFGGEHDKKFMSKRFREMLQTMQHMPMPEQGKMLHQTIETWKGHQEQSDDILVIGLRV